MAQALRLLIVDDQPESLAGLAGQLADRGHQVEVLTDPMEALARLQRAQHSPFHLAFIDVNLPGLDGPGLVRELRRRGDQTPVAFITGYHSVAARLRGELATLRVSGLITKPPPQAEIDRLLDHADRAQRSSLQERRATDFGLGSGGHQTLASGSGGHRTLTSRQQLGPGPGAGGQAQIGKGPGLPVDDDIPFYGSTRTIRPPRTDAAEPTAGILSRVTRPSVNPDIIPDHLISGQAPVSLTPLGQPATPARPRPPQRTPLPLEPVAQPPIPRQRTPDPSGFFPTSESPATGPVIRARDPVTGNYRDPSGFFPPDLMAPPTRQAPGRSLSDPDASRLRRSVAPPVSATPPPQLPGTTSRFRRSVGSAPPSTPPSAPGSPITSRIRRGITGTHGNPAAVPASDAPSCVVACAHCHGQFTVLIKPQAYTVLCVHCGQLNRIDPV